MAPKATDSLDLVEALMMIEDIFGIAIPEAGTEQFGDTRAIVDWLEIYLSNQRPNKRASAVLRRLAEDYNQLELVRDLDGLWRREQIAAVIRKIFRE